MVCMLTYIRYHDITHEINVYIYTTITTSHEVSTIQKITLHCVAMCMLLALNSCTLGNKLELVLYFGQSTLKQSDNLVRCLNTVHNISDEHSFLRPKIFENI